MTGAELTEDELYLCQVAGIPSAEYAAYKQKIVDERIAQVMAVAERIEYLKARYPEAYSQQEQ